jgi:hypothetical protein
VAVARSASASVPSERFLDTSEILRSRNWRALIGHIFSGLDESQTRKGPRHTESARVTNKAENTRTFFTEQTNVSVPDVVLVARDTLYLDT